MPPAAPAVLAIRVALEEAAGKGQPLRCRAALPGQSGSPKLVPGRVKEWRSPHLGPLMQKKARARADAWCQPGP